MMRVLRKAIFQIWLLLRASYLLFSEFLIGLSISFIGSLLVYFLAEGKGSKWAPVGALLTFIASFLIYALMKDALGRLMEVGSALTHRRRRYWSVITDYLEASESALAHLVIDVDPAFLVQPSLRGAGDKDIDHAQYVSLLAKLSNDYLDPRYVLKGAREPKRTSNLLSILATRMAEPVLVTGKPGSGKTLSLIFAFFRLKQLFLEGRSPFIPVFIKVKDVEPRLFQHILCDISALNGMPIIADSYFHTQSRERAYRDFFGLMKSPEGKELRYAFITDGLDEIRDKQQYGEMFKAFQNCIDADFSKKHKYIFSCRVDEIRGYQATLGAKIAEIEPFDYRRVLAFLKRRLRSRAPIKEEKQKWEQVIRRLSSKTTWEYMGAYIRNPYFLSLLTRYYADAKPSSDGDAVLPVDLEPLYRAELRRELRRREAITDEEDERPIMRLVSILCAAIAFMKLRHHRDEIDELRVDGLHILASFESIRDTAIPGISAAITAAVLKRDQVAYGTLRDHLGGALEDSVLESVRKCPLDLQGLSTILTEMLRPLSELNEQPVVDKIAKWCLAEPAQKELRLFAFILYFKILQLIEKAGLITIKGLHIQSFKNQRLQDYFGALYIRWMGLQQVATSVPFTFWWQQALHIYFAIADDPARDFKWLMERGENVEHYLLCARCAAYIPARKSGVEEVADAIGQLGDKLSSTLLETDLTLIDKFKVLEAFLEQTRRPPLVRINHLSAISSILTDKIPALREESALVLANYLSSGGHLGRFWLQFIEYYLRLAAHQAILLRRHWMPPIGIGRYESIYIVVYGFSWLLNLTFSLITIALLMTGSFAFIVQPFLFSPISPNLSSYVQALTFLFLLALCVYRSFGNPISLLFSFWETPWRLIMKPLQWLFRQVPPVLHAAQTIYIYASRHWKPALSVFFAFSLLIAAGYGVRWLWLKISEPRLTPELKGERHKPADDKRQASSPRSVIPTPSPAEPDPESVLKGLLEDIKKFEKTLTTFNVQRQKLEAAIQSFDFTALDRIHSDYLKDQDDNRYLDAISRETLKATSQLERIQQHETWQNEIWQRATFLQNQLETFTNYVEKGSDTSKICQRLKVQLTETLTALASQQARWAGARKPLGQYINKAPRYRYLAKSEQKKLKALETHITMLGKEGGKLVESLDADLNKLSEMVDGHRTKIDQFEQRFNEAIATVTKAWRDTTAPSHQGFLIKLNRPFQLLEVARIAKRLKTEVSIERGRLESPVKHWEGEQSRLKEMSNRLDGIIHQLSDDLTEIRKSVLETGGKVSYASEEGTLKELTKRSKLLSSKEEELIERVNAAKKRIARVAVSASKSFEEIRTSVWDQLWLLIVKVAWTIPILVTLGWIIIYSVHQFRQRRAISAMKASKELVQLMHYASDPKQTFFIRRSAVGTIAKACLVDLESFNLIMDRCKALEGRKKRNDLWIVGLLAREAYAIDRRIKESEAIV